jgi:hypothetical protein
VRLDVDRVCGIVISPSSLLSPLSRLLFCYPRFILAVVASFSLPPLFALVLRYPSVVSAPVPCPTLSELYLSSRRCFSTLVLGSSPLLLLRCSRRFISALFSLFSFPAPALLIRCIRSLLGFCHCFGQLLRSRSGHTLLSSFRFRRRFLFLVCRSSSSFAFVLHPLSSLFASLPPLLCFVALVFSIHEQCVSLFLPSLQYLLGFVVPSMRSTSPQTPTSRSNRLPLRPVRTPATQTPQFSLFHDHIPL